MRKYLKKLQSSDNGKIKENNKKPLPFLIQNNINSSTPTIKNKRSNQNGRKMKEELIKLSFVLLLIILEVRWTP